MQTAMALSVVRDNDGNIINLKNDFFNCTGCQLPNGTFVGNNGRVLHISDLTNGKISPSLLASQQVFNGLGDPAAVDINSIGPRKLQLSFHVRF